MLMEGCADKNELPMCDSLLHTWKLQHLESIPAIDISQTANCPAVQTPCSWCFRQTDTSPPTYNQVLAATTGYQKYKCEIISEPGNWVSSRWNPTPEQLQSLEELYCSGTRTPTAKQIQQIAAKLRRFGKIEGKNVFYWFQNHKSRERQKHQRKMNLGLGKPLSARKPSGTSTILRSSRTDFEITHANNRASLSNSCTSSEESVSLQRPVLAECNKDKGIKFEERQRELQQRGSRKVTAYTRWQKMEMPPATTWTTAQETLFEESGQKFSTESQEFSKLLNPRQDNVFNLELDFVEEEIRRESQTLQLFPFHPQVLDITNVAQGDSELPIPSLTKNFTPVQFYEFFPLNSKN